MAERFFPNPPADLDDIVDTTFAPETCPGGINIEQQVTAEDIARIIGRTKPWKSPGNDLLPTGFLKLCGRPLYEALAAIATASFRLGHFPKRFRSALVVVIPKPGKKESVMRTPGGWRPVSLLSTIGKVIEAAMGERITSAAEANGLLPDEQMGNRKERSTELAVRLVTEAVRTAWANGAVASLLQLDIKGAFDTVNHTRLLHTLREQGFEAWVIQWVRSYLSERTAALHFDGKSAEPTDIRAGVPQGSPLSPILFILYTASLYHDLRDKEGIITCGFADDTNILAFGKTPEDTARRLEGVWGTCTRWAAMRGVQFEPSKSELLHFTRAHTAPTTAVRLGTATIQPVESARFLGVWLDRKLTWKAHLKQIKTKLETQTFALTRLAASAWGCRLARAREIYTKVIRSAIAYGAPAYHTPATDRPEATAGIAAQLLTTQSQCLRVVAGAYRRTPVRNLETETFTPPLDLYLTKRVADFETRLEVTGKAQLLHNVCAGIAARLRTRRNRRRLNPWQTVSIPAHPVPQVAEERVQWARRWTGDRSTKEAMIRDWKARWGTAEEARRQRGRHSLPANTPDFSSQALKKHEGLRKHESSLLTQIRTETIGLNAFLFGCKVPDVMSPLCRCGRASETAAHLILHCTELTDQRRALDEALERPLRTCRDLADATREKGTAAIVVRWFLKLERLLEYRLAQRIAATTDGRTGGDTEEQGRQGQTRPGRGRAAGLQQGRRGAAPAQQ